jgi:aminoglycoside 3-N-acetyltransferase
MPAMKPITLELAEDWRRAGIAEGDLVLLHSNVRRTLMRIRRADRTAGLPELLASFLAAVGEGGTLLLPLFNFDFTQGVPFDIHSTPSHMGALTELGRMHPAAIRTGHAIYSFAAIGASAEKFAGLVNHFSYGADSPFQMLRDLGGKIAVLDLPDQNSMTFYHHVEEVLRAPYRFHKQFTGPWIGGDGVELERSFDIYVRGDGVQTHVDPMGERLWQQGLYSGDRSREGAGLRVISAQAMFEATAKVITVGEALGCLYLQEDA